MNLQNAYTENFLSVGNKKLSKEEIIKHKKVWWYNKRQCNDTSLRLTEEGFNYIKEVGIRCYEIDFPESVKLNPQILVWLDRFLDSPYFLNKKSIVVIKEKTALELHLFAGDVQKFGFVKTLSKKLNSI
jgi:hypothetical protein